MKVFDHKAIINISLYHVLPDICFCCRICSKRPQWNIFQNFQTYLVMVQERWIQNGRGSDKNMQAQLPSRAYLFQENLVKLTWMKDTIISYYYIMFTNTCQW